MVVLRPYDYYACEYLCLSLREQDRREIFNLRPYDEAVLLAQECHHWFSDTGNRCRIAWHDGRPAGLLGLVCVYPQVWEAIAFGTNAFRRVAVALARWGRHEARAVLAAGLGHRLQATARLEHAESLKYIQALGGAAEGPPARCLGKDGGDYQRFVWLKSTYGGNNDVHVQQGPETQGAAAAADGA